MAARKLQAEIDRTFKKVVEGVELFTETYDKLNTTSNQTQKDKLETELKTQIKKLQRHRDQIKTWASSNDIKDKQPLIDHRKMIETQMELFKACEKEMKTKAFSKEGLNAAAKLDPKEQQKFELCNWVTEMVDQLSLQVEQAEAEVEQINLTKKKKDSEKEARLDELERLDERRAWHIGRLELILRLLENGNLQTDAVTAVKEDIGYFVESNAEEDFEEDEGIYDELNLEEEEEQYNVGGGGHDSTPHDSVSATEPEPTPIPIPPTPTQAPAPSPAAPKTPVKQTSVREAKPDESTTGAPVERVAKKAAASPTSRKSTADSTTPKPVPATPTRTSSGPQPTPARAVPTPLPPIRYAAAAAGANAPTPVVSAAPGVAAPPTPAQLPPGLASTPASEAAKSESAPSAAPTPSNASGPTASSFAQPSPPLSSASLNITRTESPVPSVVSAAAPSSAAGSAPPAEQAAAPAAEQAQQASRAPETRLPSSLADLVTSFESAKQKSMRRDTDLASVHRILEAGLSTLPQPLDAEKPKYYVPRNPHPTPVYYPQEPSQQFASPALFAKLDIDTLFYIFYYCQGTYLQFLAASELKKQSWRFHKQYLTWFQRANEPQQITEEYEQGVYLYFDWEGSWCQRRKSDFKFEYRFLETE